MTAVAHYLGPDETNEADDLEGIENEMVEAATAESTQLVKAW